jgi:S1-C subfamily serine protease
MQRTLIATLVSLLGCLGPGFAGYREIGIRGEYGFAVYGTREGSPAADAGLRAGDLILEFDGTPLAELGGGSGVQSYVAARNGTGISLRYLRTVRAETLELEEGVVIVTPEILDPSHDRATTGLLGAPLILVTGVDEGSRAARLGVRAGDSILAVMGRQLGEETPEDWEAERLSLRVSTRNDARTSDDDPAYVVHTLTEE